MQSACAWPAALVTAHVCRGQPAMRARDDVVQFVCSHHKQHVNHTDYSAEEAEAEMETLEKWLDDKPDLASESV